jgi:ABC-type oligopeptide transport system ATPase subunit
MDPEFIVTVEPVAMVDVSIKAQLLELMPISSALSKGFR